jgi:hypothetical protein
MVQMLAGDIAVWSDREAFGFLESNYQSWGYYVETGGSGLLERPNRATVSFDKCL